MTDTTQSAAGDGETGDGTTLAERGDVFVAPVDRATFDRTVAEPVAPGEHGTPPDPIADRDQVRLWGVQPGTRTEQTFEKLARGDLVLFADGGRYVGVGTVGTTFADPDGWVAETFWADDPSRHVFTVEEFGEIDVPRAALNRVFDYQPDYRPQGLTRVAPNRVEERLPAIRLAVRRFTDRSG